MEHTKKPSFAKKVNPIKASEDQLNNEPSSIESEHLVETEKLKTELAQAKDNFLRLAAEMENLRRRTQKDVEEAAKFGITKFAKELIEVLENLNRAEASFDLSLVDDNESLKNYHAGIELTRKSLELAFERNGIIRLNPLNEDFNHEFHQAITQAPSESHRTGQIIQVVQAGYKINERLLRPAMVIVAKND